MKYIWRMEEKKELKIEKKENIILVKKTNNDKLFTDIVMYFLLIVFLFLFSYVFMGKENAKFFLKFFLKLIFLGLITN